MNLRWGGIKNATGKRHRLRVWEHGCVNLTLKDNVLEESITQVWEDGLASPRLVRFFAYTG
jgi:hypothetical protein